MESRRFAVGLGVAMGLLGLAANQLPIEILPSIHVLLGPLAVMLAAVLGGPLAGGVAGAISASATVGLWGHPYSWFGFTLEGLCVGYLARRVRPVLASLLYWSTIGAVVFFYSYLELVGAALSEALTVGLKQAVNSTLSALCIQVFLLLPAVRTRLGKRLPPPLREVRFAVVFASVVALGAALPLLVLGVQEGRSRYRAELRRMEQENVSTARITAEMIEDGVLDAERATGVLADELEKILVRDGALPPRAQLEEELLGLRTRTPELLNAYVGDARGLGIAFSPPTLPTGRSLLGTDFSDRSYVARLEEGSPLVVSEVLEGRVSPQPLVVVAAPIRTGGKLHGFVAATLDLPALRARTAAALLAGQRLRVVDGQGQIVVDSAGVPTRIIDLDGTALAQAIERAPGETTTQYIPPPVPRTALTVESTVYVGLARLDEVGWKVIVEQSGAVLEQGIARSYLGLLTGLAASAALIVLVAAGLSSSVSRPLRRIAAAASRFAVGDRSARVADAVRGAPLELRQLATDFDRMAEELAEHLSALERASRDKDAFLSIASHELKTPITVLKTQIQLHLRHTPSEQRQRVEAIVRQLDKVTRLVNQLLDASRIGMDELPLARHEVDLAALAQRIAEGLVGDSPAHRLVTDLEPTIGSWDELRLEQVLHNLVANAIKYSPRGGPIELSVHPRSGGGAVVELVDHGVGLREGTNDLFAPFARGDNGRTVGISGLGIGLYIARQIVTQHGGTITLRAHPGGGAVARLELPGEGDPPLTT